MNMELNTSTAENTRLTLELILQMIEENGTAEGLDLSGQDLSWVDLSSETIENILQERGFSKVNLKIDSIPPWISPYTWGKTLVGLNFRLINLKGANLQRANLSGVDL